MADPATERPAIHVTLAGPSAPGLYRWVEVGAEEEGVPTRYVDLGELDAIPAAFAAAQGSRLGIGVAIGQGRVVLHETHMPPAHPVLSFDLGPDGRHACRLMGSNAARLVVRLPLHVIAEPLPQMPQIEQIAQVWASGETRQSQPSPALAAGAGEPYQKNGPEICSICDISGQPDTAFVASIAAVVARILRERGIA